MTSHTTPRLTRDINRPPTVVHWNHLTVSCCPHHNAPKSGAIISRLGTRFTFYITNTLPPWTLLLMSSINRASTKNATAFPRLPKIWTQHRCHSKRYCYQFVSRRRSVFHLRNHSWNWASPSKTNWWLSLSWQRRTPWSMQTT